jgi:DNA-binding CsgD family transcriptional regulator
MPKRALSFDELVLSIHSEALAADGWNSILNNVARAVSAEGASLVRPTHPATCKPFTLLLGRDAIWDRDYQDHWAQHDCWYQGAVRNRRTGVGMVNIDSQLIDRRDFQRLPFFHDFLKPFDIERMMNVCLTAPDPSGNYGPVALSLYRGLGKESFSAKQADLLTRLAPHLTLAAQNYWAAQSLQLLARARSNALDAVAAAVFALNHSGKLLFANRLGEDMIRQCAWVRVLHERLVPIPTVHPLDRFAAALSSVSSGLGCEFLTTDLVTGKEAQISIAPLPVDTDFGFLPTRLFDLTPAERRILDKLIAGDDLLEAAASLRVSIHTARTQLKSMFRKTGRRSQGQLLMLAARIATLSSTRG